MSLIHFSLQHGRSLAEAQAKLEQIADEVQKNLQVFIQRVEWSAERKSVLMWGTGFQFTISVDEKAVYVDGDIPLLAKLLGSQAVTNVKRVLEQTFQQRLKD